MKTLKLIGTLFGNLLLGFSPALIALAINPFNHTIAYLIFNVWFFGGLVFVMTAKRPPCNYGSYGAWWKDRANWYKDYEKNTNI